MTWRRPGSREAAGGFVLHLKAPAIVGGRCFGEVEPCVMQDNEEISVKGPADSRHLETESRAAAAAAAAGTRQPFSGVGEKACGRSSEVGRPTAPLRFEGSHNNNPTLPPVFFIIIFVHTRLCTCGGGCCCCCCWICCHSLYSLLLIVPDNKPAAI